jgi:transcriptional regulator with XRE-family HTH domain
MPKTATILPMAPRKRSFTTAEMLIEEVRNNIFKDGRSYKEIALKTGVAQSTINNLATGKTRWPRPTTLFPALDTLNLEMRLVRRAARSD